MNVNLAPRVVAISAREWLSFLDHARTAISVGGQPNAVAAQDGAPDGVAVVRVEGVLLPSVPEWMRRFGVRATGYDEIAQQVAAAAENADVKEIVLAVDSPGGTVQGTVPTAAAIRMAATAKTVTAWIEGSCESGAYWICSGATQIVACKTATVGSLGVYEVWYDDSSMLDRSGITTHVVRSGPMKGVGIDRMTREQLDAEQQTVDDLAAIFVQTVAAGRGLSAQDAAALATGQSWTAERARPLGLVDFVLETYNYGQVVSDEMEVTMAVNKNTARPVAVREEDDKEKDTPISEDPKPDEELDTPQKEEPENAQPEPDGEDADDEDTASATAGERARCASIVSAFGKLDAAFCAEMIESGASETEAKAAWFDRQKATGAPAAAPLGVQPIQSAAAPGDNAKPRVRDRIMALVTQEKIPVEQAVKRVQAEDPALFARYQRGENV